MRKQNAQRTVREKPDLSRGKGVGCRIAQGPLTMPTSPGLINAFSIVQSGDAHSSQRISAAQVVQKSIGNQACIGILQRRHGEPDSLNHTVCPQVRESMSVNAIQRRRVPSQADVTSQVAGTARNSRAGRRGLAELVRRSMAELNPAQQAAVRTRARGALTAAQFAALPRRQKNTKLAEAVHHLHPNLRAGDPRLFLTGPRPATADVANLATLIIHANALFAAIASGAHDASIGQVFGVGNIAAVKSNYATAQAKMVQLYATNKIVTDRSGYAREVGLGGLTDSTMIMLSSGSIDNPSNTASRITLLHEAMHAGNSSIDDRGYIRNAKIFTSMTATDKLQNAAHYEVVPRRILGAAHSYAGQTFIPAGTTVGGVAAPALTPVQQGLRQAGETFRKAWGTSLDIHEMYMDVHINPLKWSVPLAPLFSGAHANARFRNVMPYWSKVTKLTIHNKTGVSATHADVSRRPVSMIDIALSEGVARKLSRAMSQRPRTAAAAATFITTHTTPAQRAGMTTSAARTRNLLLRLVRQHITGRITGSRARDLAMIRRLAWANVGNFSRILRPRSPSAWPFP